MCPWARHQTSAAQKLTNSRSWFVITSFWQSEESQNQFLIPPLGFSRRLVEIFVAVVHFVFYLNPTVLPQHISVSFWSHKFIHTRRIHAHAASQDWRQHEATHAVLQQTGISTSHRITWLLLILSYNQILPRCLLLIHLSQEKQNADGGKRTINFLFRALHSRPHSAQQSIIFNQHNYITARDQNQRRQLCAADLRHFSPEASFQSKAADVTSTQWEQAACWGVPGRSARSLSEGDSCVIDRWPCCRPPPEETLKPNKCWIRQGDPHIDINQLFTYLRWLAKSSSAAFSYAPDRHAFCRKGNGVSPAITPRLILQLWWTNSARSDSTTQNCDEVGQCFLLSALQPLAFIEEYITHTSSRFEATCREPVLFICKFLVDTKPRSSLKLFLHTERSWTECVTTEEYFCVGASVTVHAGEEKKQSRCSYTSSCV